MTSERHWSTFEIDVAFAEGLSAHPELEAHLAECDECKAYVDELRAMDVPPVARIAPKRRWLAPAVASFALAAAVLLFLRQRTPEQPGYVGVKGGTPASMLLLKRGDVTRPWDGKEPVRPSDIVAIQVSCEGARRVTVLAKDGAAWVQVAENACPAEAGVLPFTLVVDERPGTEEIRVVFDRENAQSHFVLPKETSR